MIIIHIQCTCINIFIIYRVESGGNTFISEIEAIRKIIISFHTLRVLMKFPILLYSLDFR
jgi:hypothetical protein